MPERNEFIDDFAMGIDMKGMAMDRRVFLKIIGAGVSAGMARPVVATAAVRGKRPNIVTKGKRPNIVMIYADDLDFDEVNLYEAAKFPSRTGAVEAGIRSADRRGYRDRRMLMPHVESLARDGAVLNRFYITSSICTPSRYSVLTGRFASRSLGFLKRHPAGGPANIGWNTPLEPQESNVARELGKCGYATGVVGKWHCGVRGGKAKGIAGDADPNDPGVAAKIKAAYEEGIAYIRENFGFDFVERIYFNNKEALGLPESMKVHNLEWITEGALKFIEGNRDRAFFLYMPLTTPHGPYGTGFLKANPRFTPGGVLDKAPAVQPSRQSIVRRLEKAGIDTRNAMATWIDDSVGAVLKKLDELGIGENTVVIFTSDHQSRGKYTCYEGSRAPFVVRWPGKVMAGGRVDAICANIDLAPTFIDIAGGRSPADMSEDGRSMVDLLLGRGGRKQRRDSLLLECSNIRAVVTERWKYVANRPSAAIREGMDAEARECAKSGKKRRIGWDGKENTHNWEDGIRFGADLDFPDYFDYDQLYDLENDVYEQKNLAKDPKYAGELAQMKEMLKARLKGLPHTFGEFKVR